MFPTKKKIYTCKYCGKEFTGCHAIGGHVSSHSEERNKKLKEFWNTPSKRKEEIIESRIGRKSNIPPEKRQEICQKIWEKRRINCGPTGLKSEYYKTEEWSQKLSNAVKKSHDNPTEEMIQGRKKTSKTLKDKWSSDENFVKRQLEAQSHHHNPTSLERIIINLIEKYNLPFEFTGNGNKLIGRLKPDFTSTSGENLLIEVYYSFYHPLDYQLIRKFQLSEYRILFLSDKDFSGRSFKQRCLKKIEIFLYFFSKKWRDEKYGDNNL